MNYTQEAVSVDKPTTVKCILIGDSEVGKTSLVVSYTSNGYPAEYKPSALDTYCVDLYADTRPINLQICDAGGKAEVSSLRHLAYPGTHVILLCFSVVKPESFRSLRTIWLSELAFAPIVLNPIAELTASHLLNSSSCYSGSKQSRTTSSVCHRSKNIVQSRGIKNVTEISTIPGPTFLLIGCACDLRNDIGKVLELSKIGEEPVDKGTAESLAAELGAEAYVECSALTQKNLKTVFDLAVWCGLKIADAGGPAQRLVLDLPIVNNGHCTKPNVIESKSNHDSVSSKESNQIHNLNLPNSIASNTTTIDNSNNHNTVNPYPIVAAQTNKTTKRSWRRFFCID